MSNVLTSYFGFNVEPLFLCPTLHCYVTTRCISIYQSIDLYNFYTHPSTNLSIYLSIYLSFFLSIHGPIGPLVYLIQRAFANHSHVLLFQCCFIKLVCSYMQRRRYFSFIHFPFRLFPALATIRFDPPKRQSYFLLLHLHYKMFAYQ